MISIVPAQNGDMLEHMITLSGEYVTWLNNEIGRHFPELNISELMSEHDYDDIRRKFPGDHVPPDGCLLIATSGSQVAGCVAVGRLSDTVCEMRTLFVRSEFRGAGIGRKLAEASLEEAIKLGYETIRLDTLGFMTGALQLYDSLGFYEIEPYRDVSDALKFYIRFLECQLSE
ncbi:MAG: GNAT family N-acetyltransferase [Chloroflexi bacterium]|nr:GNAT family N-acetyltransferase [Chloroflexota bacterium]